MVWYRTSIVKQPSSKRAVLAAEHCFHCPPPLPRPPTVHTVMCQERFGDDLTDLRFWARGGLLVGCLLAKGLGTRCNFLTSATSGLPQVAIQIAVLAAHVATLNRSPRNPIPNKENSRGTTRDFSFAQAMGHRVIQNAAL